MTEPLELVAYLMRDQLFWVCAGSALAVWVLWHEDPRDLDEEP